jgi:hypothetical protein
MRVGRDVRDDSNEKSNDKKDKRKPMSSCDE